MILQKRHFNQTLISRLSLGPVETNCYILIDPQVKSAAVVDPADEGRTLVDLLRREGMNLQSILLTHGHFDHIGGIAELLQSFKVEILIHQLDAPMLSDAKRNFSYFLGNSIEIKEKVRFLSDGMKIAVGNQEMSVVHTPGHTPGSICILGEGFVLAGDTLFRNSIGRTDLPGSSLEILLDSIRKKLMVLDDGVVVFPGHGDETSIGHERKRNPFLK